MIRREFQRKLTEANQKITMLKDFLIWFERSDGTRGYAIFTENKEMEAMSSFF